MTVFWRVLADGVSVTVKVQPKSRRPGVQGLSVSGNGPCLRIGVSAAAEAGRANKAVCEVMAEALGISAASVTVMVGQTSRDKTLRVTGDSAVLAERLAALGAC